jgi:hypothetical protein
MVFLYPSGETVKRGDRIRYAGHPGEVEFVADPNTPDSSTAWYVTEHGGGCMITTLQFGSIFLNSTSDEEDLEFVSRAGS